MERVICSKSQHSDGACRQTGEKQPGYYCAHMILMLAHVLLIHTKQSVVQLLENLVCSAIKTEPPGKARRCQADHGLDDEAE
jgi:hypothetical protein